jgi:hypothetical protein
MKIIRGDGRDFGDDELKQVLSSQYAAPSDESYWATLERRVMAHLLSDGLATREWWFHFRGWARAGLAAGIAAALVAGAAAWRTRDAHERVVVEELLRTQPNVTILTETVGNEPSASSREATLRYLLSK